MCQGWVAWLFDHCMGKKKVFNVNRSARFYIYERQLFSYPLTDKGTLSVVTLKFGFYFRSMAYFLANMLGIDFRMFLYNNEFYFSLSSLSINKCPGKNLNHRRQTHCQTITDNLIPPAFMRLANQQGPHLIFRPYCRTRVESKTLNRSAPIASLRFHINKPAHAIRRPIIYTVNNLPEIMFWVNDLHYIKVLFVTTKLMLIWLRSIKAFWGHRTWRQIALINSNDNDKYDCHLFRKRNER